VDTGLARRLVQRIDRAERRAVEAEDDVAFTQPGTVGRTAGFDRDRSNPILFGEAMVRDDAAIDPGAPTCRRR
jgi:hypothetical protein